MKETKLTDAHISRHFYVLLWTQLGCRCGTLDSWEFNTATFSQTLLNVSGLPEKKHNPLMSRQEFYSRSQHECETTYQFFLALTRSENTKAAKSRWKHTKKRKPTFKKFPRSFLTELIHQTWCARQFKQFLWGSVSWFSTFSLVNQR